MKPIATDDSVAWCDCLQVCLQVCLSLMRLRCVKMAKQIDVFLFVAGILYWVGVSHHSIYALEVFQRIRGFLKWYALYKFTFYLLTYLLIQEKQE